MAETNPLINMSLLQDALSDSPTAPANLPNVPFRKPATPLPMVDGQPTPSALSAIENSVLATPAKQSLQGGSIPRGLDEVESSRYNVIVPGDYNNEDAYAQGQGWPAKMVNGVGKGIGLTGTTLLQTTLGTLNGLAKMIETGKAASFYDNEFNRVLDEINKAAEDWLPNYYTDVEKNSNWYSPSKLFTANFLWDGIVKNLGFAAGAAISGGLYASALKTIPLTSRLFSIGKAAETLAATEEALLSAGKAAETYGKVKSLSDKFLSSYNLLNPAGRGLVAALSTTGEAGFEAFHNLNDFRAQKIQEYKDSHAGQYPKGADLDSINSESERVGNSSFMLNTALLSATNYIQFPAILGSSYTAEKGILNSLKHGVSEVTQDASGNFIKKEATTRTGKILASLDNIRPYLFSTSEAFEEGAQYAITVGTQDYYNKKYDGDVASFLESMVEGISKTVSTNEGIENILIGGLSGAIMLGKGRFQESAEKRKNTADAIQKFNQWKLSDFTRDTVDSVNRGTALQKERETLIRQGDILESKDKEADYIINYLTPRIKYGRYDLVRTDIDEYQKLANTEEGFAQLQSEGKALSTDTRIAYIERLSNLAITADNMKSLYQSLQLRYGNLVNSKSEAVYNGAVMDQMLYAATKVSDYDRRLPQIATTLIETGIDTTSLSKGSKVDQQAISNAVELINELDTNSDIKDDLKSNLRDFIELSLRRDKFIKEYDNIKKNPEKYKVKDRTEAEEETESIEVKQKTKINGKTKTVPKELEVGKEYSLGDLVRREDNKLQISPKLTVISKTLGGEFEVVLPSGETSFLTPSQFKDYNIGEVNNDFPQLTAVIDSIIDEVVSRSKYKDISVPTENKLEYINSLDNKKLIDDILTEINTQIDKFKQQQEEAARIAKDKALRQEILGTADTGLQTRENDNSYEPASKKTNIGVVTSTKPATSSTLPHHVRANTFGTNLDTFPNRGKIKGVLVTSKNEGQILPGLTAFLKGDSDVDPSKIIAIVMVQDGKPVGVDGKILTSPSTENAIFQVMPDPSLTWSKEFGGGSMFRKDTTPEQIEYYKKQYAEWVKETLANPSLKEHDITASFGIPEYVTYKDEKGNIKRDYTAVVPVADAGLIKNSQLKETPLLKVSTLDTIDKGSTAYTNSLGRVFLTLPNAYVALQNRKLTKREAVTIYEAIHQLSLDIFKNGDARSDRSKRLINWLKSTIYWGTPKNKAGYNSVFFDSVDEDFRLFISGKDHSYPFTPSSIEGNKSEIVTLLEGMYNNVQSGRTDKVGLWDDVYEEIVNITPQGEIETKEWPNYQTYLLSTEGRKKEELPLSVQIKPIKEGETNRTGIYFTIKDNEEKFSTPPAKKELQPKKAQPKTSPKGTYVLDGKTINDFVAPSGKVIKFFAKSLETVTIVKGGDLDSILAELTAKVGAEKAKENIKNTIKVAIAPQLKLAKVVEDEIIIGEEEQEAPKKSIFNKGKAATPPIVEITKDDENQMEIQIDDLEDDEIVLRVAEEIDSYEKEDWTEIEKWLTANFPNFPVYRVKNIIQTTNGLQAWGMLKDGALYVYENAEVGTIYHEVFEGVWKTFATPSEQQDVIAEFKARKGSFIDRPTGRTVKYSDASDFEVKEQLAEEFRDYVLNKKTEKKGFISKLFADIIDFITAFFAGNKAKSNTDKLFKKIGSGYYKQYTPLQPKLFFAKKGIIDIEEAFASANSDFRIANLPADTVHEIMQQMTYITLIDLIKSNESLFNIPKINKTELYTKLKTDLQKTVLRGRKAAQNLVKEGKMTEAQAAPIIQRSASLWKSIGNEWDALRKKHEEYLRIYSIEFDENDDVILKDEDASRKGDYQDATKIDTFKKANSAIKMLLSTIPRVTSNGKLQPSSIGGAQLLPTSEVFMAIMNTVHDARNIDEMMDRLKDMAEENLNYRTLYNRLTKNTSDLSQIATKHDAQLLAAFWRTFKKQNPEVKNVYIFENGDIEVGDSSLSSAARQISADYGNAIIRVVKSKNPYFEYNEKEKIFRGKPVGVKNVKLTNDDNRIAFLKTLGIEFKKSELNKLSGDKLEIFREATAGIRRSIEKADRIATVNRKVLDIKGRLMQLSLIRASIDNPEFDSTFFNVKGERTQSFIGTNPVSDLYDILSQISNKSELIGTPFEYLLTDSFSQNSIILDKMFNPETGNRIKGSELLMKPGYADGTVDLQKGKKKQSSKLNYKERLIQEINLNLKGYYYNLVPGDASIEWMVFMGNHVTSDNLLSGSGKVHDIFKGYFISELNLSREDRPVNKKRDSKDLRFFKGILGDDLHKKILKEKGSPEIIYTKYQSQIDKAVDAFIASERRKFNDSLLKYGIIQTDADGLLVENLSFASEGNMSVEELDRHLNALTINFIINNIELHKLLYSDPYQYNDELKRIKSANSPRQPIISNSPSLNAALNKVWNIGFAKEDIGYTDFTKDYFSTVTLADVVSTTDLKDYGSFEETDGGGIISMKSYRAFRIKAGEWNDEEERQFQYDIAYEKQIKKLELSENDEQLLKKGNPSIRSAYTPIKPIVFGNKANRKQYNDIVLDKFALYPLSFRIAHSINPDSNAIRHYNKMQRENIDYTVFASGRKVGNEGTNSLYNPDGSFNTLPFRATVRIPHSIISIQSEVPSKEDNASPRGSQMTKLATLDYMEAGIPIDFGNGKNSFKVRFEIWNNLTEKEKQEQSPLYKEIKYNQQLLEASIEQSYVALLSRMGIRETEDGGFEITDTEKIANTLEEEILKREVNDNILDAFEGFRKGDVVLEATPAYQQIRNILYSIADKNVISPKITGGQKVQIPSTLLESVRAKEEKGAYTSDILRFYENADGKRTCEIMIGRWFDSSMTDEELLNYLNKTQEGQEILGGIAYRIPTQKQNSIESFVVKQFLPQEFGDSVIIPSALVKKVGSDFDIDKLYIYLKNIYKDHKGKVKLLPFYGFGNQAVEKFRTLFLDIKELSIKETESKLAKQFSLSSLFTDLALGLKEGKVSEKWIPIFREWFADELVDGKFPVYRIQEIFMSRIDRLNKKLDKLTDEDIQEVLASEMSERWYKQSIENEYIKSLQNLTSHPLNFDNLVKPNSANQLKSLSKEITKKRGVEEFDYGSTDNMLSREFMTRLRHSFVSGKYAIGIAAVNQTNHSLNQRQPIYIDIDRWDLLSQDDQYWLSGGTMNPEDITVKFKEFNKIEIGDRIVPTLSMIKNPAGEYISDIIGQFIDGYVDISKGPWIMELGASPNVAGVWLFLAKIGVPITDVAYFMNQPIITDYLRTIESAGYSWLFIDTFVDDMIKTYSPSQVREESELPSTSALEKMIGKKVSEMSEKQKNQQLLILKEFLKYAKMANHMFLVTQGSNFDTANFNDPYLVFKKQEQYRKAQSTIISSVNSLVENSFVGKLKDTIYSLRDAFSTVLSSDRNEVRDVIEDILRPYVDLPDRDFVKLAQKSVNDLFDWVVQTDRDINKQVANILLSDNNAAKQVSDFVVSVRRDTKHPLYNNQVIKLVTPHFSEKVGGVNNLKIKNKENKVYDQNQLIYAFAELRNYLRGSDNPLYGSLVRLAVLQSGLSNSPISFTSLLPYEDFKEIYNKTLSTLENLPNLQDFKTLNVFQRTNWNNDDIVPLRRAKKSRGGEGKYNTNMRFYGNNQVIKAIERKEIPPLLKINNLSKEINNDVVTYTWVTAFGDKAKKMKEAGDFSYIKKGLFKKIYKGNEPFTQSYTIKDEKTGENKVITDTIYKAINAWGDSHSSDGIYFSANEFYDVARPSVIDNGFIKVEKEVDDATIIQVFNNKKAVIEKNEKGEDQIPKCI